MEVYRVPASTWFDNYHKVAVCDHVHEPKFWFMLCTQANTKKHKSGIIPLSGDFPNNFF